MPQVVGIRFKPVERIHYFDPGDLPLASCDYVVAESPQGMDIGQVVIAPQQVIESQVTEALKPVQRKAQPEDLEKMGRFKGREQDALDQAKEKVAQAGLPMKLLKAEYTFDGSKLTIYFGAEGRVDFRQLVRTLAATFRTRIELRQVGPRDEAKLLGGVGRCGRALCCASHLAEFKPVAIQMAKDQDLPLNPARISGICGRLLCCLAFENELYCEGRQRFPRIGSPLDTPHGLGVVVAINILKGSITVKLPSDALVEMPIPPPPPSAAEPSP